MPRSLHPWEKLKATAFYKLYKPAQNILPGMPELKARGDRPLQMEFEHQLKALILFHLEEHTGQHDKNCPFEAALHCSQDTVS